MKISWLKSKKDNESFRIMKGLGFDVYEVQDLEETDEKLKELVTQKYDTIVVSNEVANFSQDIIKRYHKKENLNIIISPPKHDKNEYF